ncbi:MAG TPA: NPCBM/NEW2 domain-containing protein [Opitutaceae bacterium]|jgi:hypothetical protein|nr:NPCBM/NEW2 domain-containing protein [Opitutaceae bacterium]
MLSILFLSCLVWLGFVIDEEFSISRGDFLVRLASAVILGCFWSTWAVFLLSLAFGFNPGAVIGVTGLMLGFNLYAWRFRRRNLAWFASLCTVDKRFWQASFVPTFLVTLYFAVCVWINGNGDILFRGNTQDLAFHMGTVSAFLEQNIFPPLNPQSAVAKLSYHFMADFFSAILCRGGFSLFYSLKIPMVLFAFALCSLTCHFLYSVLKTRSATLFAGFLFFFGHIGIVNLAFGLAGYPSGSVPLSLSSWQSVSDHLTYPYYNFLNVIIDYFQPQLPFLFGFPLAMLVLAAMYRRYSEQTVTDRTTYFLLGLIAFLPLFHMHTFLILGPLAGLMVWFERTPPARMTPSPRPPRNGFVTRLIRLTVADDPIGRAKPAGDLPKAVPSSSRESRSPHTLFKIIAVCLAMIPIGLQLGFIFSQKKTAGFSGFDVAQQLGSLPEIPRFLHLQRAWFWLRAAGLQPALGLLGAFFSLGYWMRGSERERRREVGLFILLAVTGFYFAVINFYRFTPNWGDSNKFFLYLDLVFCIYAGRLLSFCWKKSSGLKFIACLLVSLSALIPTAIEWTIRYQRQPEELFSAGDRLVAEWIRINTPKDAVFLTANSTVHLVPALAGRRVVNGAYTRATGFADEETEQLVARVYREFNPALIKNVAVTYVLVGPEEEGLYHVDRTAWARRYRVIYDQSCLGMRYSVYDVRERNMEEISQDQANEAPPAFIWLSALEPASVQQSYGTLRFDQSFDQTPLMLQGRKYSFGLGTHASSEIHFDLNGGYRSFESDIGVDDSQIGGIGSVTFEVWVDNRKTYESKILHAGDPPKRLRIDVSGAAILKLVVTDAGDGNHCDHADWAGAKLIKKPQP